MSGERDLGEERTRVDQMETMMKEMAGQIQTLTNAVLNMASTPRASEDIRREPREGEREEVRRSLNCQSMLHDITDARLNHIEGRLDRVSTQLTSLIVAMRGWATPQETNAEAKERRNEYREYYTKKAREKSVGTSRMTKQEGAQKRHFSRLEEPMTEILDKLQKEGLLTALKPRPMPNPIPRHMDMDQYCHYHQEKGHSTDSCTRLRHEIQDLIDNGKIREGERR